MSEQIKSRLDEEKRIHKERIEKNKEIRRFKSVIKNLCKEREVNAAKYQFQYLKENPQAFTITSNSKSITSTTLIPSEALDVIEGAINEYIKNRVEEMHPNEQSRNQKRLD